MKKLLKFLKPYILECIFAPAFKMLEALFELFVPLVMSKIIDEGIVNKDIEIIKHYGLILILLGVIGLICSITAQFFAAKAAVSFSETLREELYERILNFSFENIESIGTSSLITRITSDLNQVQNGVNMVLRLLLRSPFVVFGAMIMAFTISVKAAIIFVIMIPLLFVVVILITLITIPMYKGIQRHVDTLTTHIRENLSGVRVVRAFNNESSEKASFKEDNEKLYNLSVVTAKVSSILNPATLIIVNVSMLILIYNGSNLVNMGALTSGQVYALVNYMSQILVELVKLTNLIITINKSLASASRISDTLELNNALKDEGTIDATKLESKDKILEFRDVTFTYPESKEVFMEHVSFEISRNETIGIIGGTGSGKSTLINLLMRMYDVTDGGIFYNGTNIKELTLSSLRRVFSIVPQKAQLFSGTLRENLLLANDKATESEMLKAIEISQASDIVNKKGEGLLMKIEEAGANLSGGQKQRLTIARALVRNTPILILDDSSSALDYKTDANLRNSLKTLKDTTVFIISQRIISIKDADKILVMDDGELVAMGTHEELLKSSPVYKEIYDSQNKKEESL